MFRYSHVLTPYSKAVPAVIAKASAIYNPFIYAIIRSKYRDTLAEKVPCLHFLAQSSRRDCISVSNSESSFKEPMLSRQSSGSKVKFQRVSSMSTTDTVWSDVELDLVDQKTLRNSPSANQLRDEGGKTGQTKQGETENKRRPEENHSGEKRAVRESFSLNDCGLDLASESINMATVPLLMTKNTPGEEQEEKEEHGDSSSLSNALAFYQDTEETQIISAHTSEQTREDKLILDLKGELLESVEKLLS